MSFTCGALRLLLRARSARRRAPQHGATGDGTARLCVGLVMGHSSPRLRDAPSHVCTCAAGACRATVFSGAQTWKSSGVNSRGLGVSLQPRLDICPYRLAFQPADRGCVCVCALPLLWTRPRTRASLPYHPTAVDAGRDHTIATAIRQSLDGADNARLGFQFMQHAQKNPDMMQDVMKDLQDPETMEKVQEMMQVCGTTARSRRWRSLLVVPGLRRGERTCADRRAPAESGS